MRRYIIIGICSIIVITCFLTYYYFIQGVDTKYAITYSEVFGSYDIRQVDQYLNEETIITYKGVSASYKELRENVVHAFKTKKFRMLENSSYGSDNQKNLDGVQEVHIESYVEFDNKSYEVSVIMMLETKGINKFSVKSLSSNDEFFGYLFFGIVEK